MNRIVLVGNGFDLAHGLPTRYEDFIDWYWTQWVQQLLFDDKKIEEDELYSPILKVKLDSWIRYCNKYTSEKERMYQVVNLVRNDKDVCEFKKRSIFFDGICNTIEEKNWVDIEDEYYKFLRSFLGTESQYEKPDILNRELDFIKSKLIEYLRLIQEDQIEKLSLKEEIKKNIFSPLEQKDIAVSARDIWQDFIKRRNTLSANEWNSLFCDYDSDMNFSEDILFPDRIMLLNFNYTSTADMYLPHKGRFIVNHIHGELDKEESVIFGYGDEADEDYRKLQKLNDNEYLRNVKTIRYLESGNYRKMLSFIESAPYQICIMGHSCGNSDHTLLNTLFEHKNCVSIKPYYYQKEDGSDNYLEIVQNICRNFKDMQLMRDRVVNKEYCVPIS